MIDHYNITAERCIPHPGGGTKLVVEVYYKPEGVAAIKQPPTTQPFTISCALGGGELPTTIPDDVITGKLRQYMGGELLELGGDVYNARKKKGYITEELDKAAGDALRSLVLTAYCMLVSNDEDEEYIAKVRELGSRADTLRRNNYPGIINE